MNAPPIIRLPAEQWGRLSEVNSCQLAAEHRGKPPVPVRVAEYRGCLYTVFSVLWGSYGADPEPRVDAWRLLPLPLYEGKTTTAYHDEEAIREGRRQRGDHTGLIVSVGGKPMVCAQRVWFYVDPPTTRPMTLAEAEDYDAQSRSSGWRSLWFRGKQPEWYSLRGHPVAVYRGHVTLGTDHAVLLWKKADGDVRELSIHRSVALEPVSRLPERQACGGNPVLAGQLALF